jgi:anthranilate synthase component 1
MSYDLVKYFENIDIPPAGTGFPEMMLYLTDCIIVFDHLLNTVNIIATVKNDSSDMDCKKAYRLSCEKIMQIENIIFKPFRHGTNHENNIRYNLMQQSHTGGNTDGILFENNGTIPQLKNLSKSIFQDAPDGIFQNSNLSLTSNFTMGSFTEAVNRAKRYINEGEVFQLVLSQRFEVGNFSGQIDAFSIYRILRNLNPSPYMYYLSFNDFKIIGSSPEPLIKVTGRKIITCPIAGTRKRGRNEGEDKKIITSLLSDDKEKAEHNMLVDLSRNDLGRVCRYGSVKVKRYMKVEKYSHVVHLVSRVEGLLKKEETIFNALKSTFPAGTLTGAPKIRAMQLISGLEPVRRGPYGGIIGYFGYDSSLDCCITIRTALAKDNKVYIQAGAGIVYDSVAENEYLETLNKAKALLYAVIRGGQNQNNYER